MDGEALLQYRLPLTCPECGEHTFQTDAGPKSELDLVGAECTNCGHALTSTDIATQAISIPPEAFRKALA
jgi:DNA polymerase III alpha subunit (gram-positive type)